MDKRVTKLLSASVSLSHRRYTQPVHGERAALLNGASTVEIPHAMACSLHALHIVHLWLTLLVLATSGIVVECGNPDLWYVHGRNGSGDPGDWQSASSKARVCHLCCQGPRSFFMQCLDM